MLGFLADFYSINITFLKGIHFMAYKLVARESSALRLYSSFR